jgi:hypothetical protein
MMLEGEEEWAVVNTKMAFLSCQNLKTAIFSKKK